MDRKVLVVDDEKLIVKGIKFSLEQDGMAVDVAYDGEEALRMVREKNYDIVFLDVMLPKLSGYEVCQQIREFSMVPVIMITAKSEDMDKILGLEYGADDYITKPFNAMEVLARVRAVLRRLTRHAEPDSRPNVLRVGGIEMDLEQKTVTCEGEEISTTPKEYDILKLLMQNPGRVFSSREIYQRVWQDIPLGPEGTVAVHIRHLREKLEINPADPRYIKVVWGKGYKMESKP